MLRTALSLLLALMSTTTLAQGAQSLGPGFECKMNLIQNQAGGQRLNVYIAEPVVSVSTSGGGQARLIVETAGQDRQVYLNESASFEYRVPGVHVSAAEGHFYLVLAPQESGEWTAKGFMNEQILSGYCLQEDNVIRHSESI